MRRKRKLSCLLAALGAAAMIAGCGGGGQEQPAPTLGEGAGEIAVVAYPWTPEVQQPVGFRPGGTAWIVAHENDMGPAEVQGAVVIAEIEGYLITSPQYCGEGADRELMWELVLRSDDGRRCLGIWPIGDCYLDPDAAQAAADAENAYDWYTEEGRP